MTKIIIHVEDGLVNAVHSNTDIQYVVVYSDKGTPVHAGIMHSPDSIQELDLMEADKYCEI